MVNGHVKSSLHDKDHGKRSVADIVLGLLTPRQGYLTVDGVKSNRGTAVKGNFKIIVRDGSS